MQPRRPPTAKTFGVGGYAENGETERKHAPVPRFFFPPTPSQICGVTRNVDHLTSVGTRLFFTKPDRENKDTAESAAVSAVFHALLILLIVLLTRTGVLVVTGDQGVGTGIGSGDAGGGGGGGQEDVISILVREPEPQPAMETAELVIPTEVEKPVVEQKPIEEVQIAKVDSTPKPPAPAPQPLNPPGGTGTGEGTGTGAGTGAGTGPGSGGGSGGGTGGGIGSGTGPGTGRGKVLSPSPEVLLVPPTPPGNLRGKEFVVRLAVDSTGVVKDAEIIPSTGNRKYDDTLKKTALGWRFRAARDAANRPVAVLFEVTFKF
jgi:TonB family protein